MYFDDANPPAGLAAAHRTRPSDFARWWCSTSLSKRSNLPGLRSGFVAGDAEVLKRFLLYRTYHGCAMPVQAHWPASPPGTTKPTCAPTASCTAPSSQPYWTSSPRCWMCSAPMAASTYGPRTPADEQQFTRELFATQHVTVVPGSYLRVRWTASTRGPAASAWRWSRRWPNASRPPSAIRT